MDAITNNNENNHMHDHHPFIGSAQELFGYCLGLGSIAIAYAHEKLMPYLDIHLANMAPANIAGIKDALDVVIKICQLALVLTGIYFAVKGGLKKTKSE